MPFKETSDTNELLVALLAECIMRIAMTESIQLLHKVLYF